MKYKVYNKKFQDITNTENWVMSPDGKLFSLDYDALTRNPNVLTLNPDAFAADDRYMVLKSLECSLKIMNNIISETIKAEDGEESSVEKFKNIKSFAIYLKAMHDVLIRYVEENNG